MHSEETKRRLSDMRQGSRNPMFGRKHSPEALAKIAAATTKHNAARQYDLEPRKLRSFSELEASYLAAMVDGEGSITAQAGRPVVMVYNTSTVLMEWLVERIGRAYRTNRAAGRNPCHVWSVSAANDVAYVLERILPYLVIKSDRADLQLSVLRRKYGSRLRPDEEVMPNE